MRQTGDNIFSNVDWALFGIYLILVFLGVTNIYSASYSPEHSGIFDLGSEHGKQLMWFGISIFFGIIILFLESSFIRKYSYAVYGVTCFLLAGVLFTPAVNGAHSWFGIGGFGIQPSEFAKLGVALALAQLLDQTKGQMIGRQRSRTSMGLSNLWGLVPFIQQNFRIVLVIGLPAILILLQPDAGTFIVFTAFILVLYREGYAGNILLFMIIAVIVAVITLIVSDNSFILPGLKIKLTGKTGIVLTLLLFGLIFYLLIRSFVLPRNRKTLYRALFGSLLISILFVNFIEWGYSSILQPHQKERIDLTLGKIDDPDGKGYNINRAKAAIGSGGFLGKGYRQAVLANAEQRHVPMQSTDFIFCTWSEERGFIGSFFLVILYTIMLIRMVVIAERQRSRYTRVFAYSVACIFFYHYMINVGMAIGLAPVIGIPLPFFSYGGSSLLSFSMLLFILLKLDSERKIVLQ